MEAFFDYIDKHQDAYVALLKEAVAIPSVSADVAHRKSVVEMCDWMDNELQKVGCQTEKRFPGKQKLEGQEIDLPPILLAQTLPFDPKKKTVLVYGHLDVQPALREDGWSSDPFHLEERNGKLYGRGSTDDKGPVLGWLAILQSHKALGIDLPVNLKCCFEGMEESGSEGLEECVVKEAQKGGYFDNVDCVCISDNYWLGRKKPCITYGLRGLNYFHLTVAGPGWDLHSGVHGGCVHEPMTVLTNLFTKLVNFKGEITIPGINEMVAPLTDTEKKKYEGLEFDIQTLNDSVGADVGIYPGADEILLHRWRYPSLSMHGIEGAFSGAGAKTVIPAKVIGKFSIRTVPDMDPDRVTACVVEHVKAEFAKLNSKCRMEIVCTDHGKPWVADVNHWNYAAGAKAVERIFKEKVQYTREGGSIPITLTFQEALGKSVVLIPMGACDDGAHSTNEKVDRRNYIEGIKVLGAYLHEVAAIQT